ncbi:hypothetical protein WM94_21155 [Pseudomonas sp. ABFPK]|nr:hypothetical protein WM94_21155 [Pseudomonas sp. ABFPK]
MDDIRLGVQHAPVTGGAPIVFSKPKLPLGYNQIYFHLSVTVVGVANPRSKQAYPYPQTVTTHNSARAVDDCIRVSIQKIC